MSINGTLYVSHYCYPSTTFLYNMFLAKLGYSVKSSQLKFTITAISAVQSDTKFDIPYNLEQNWRHT